jgi:hypothetical protein
VHPVLGCELIQTAGLLCMPELPMSSVQCEVVGCCVRTCSRGSQLAVLVVFFGPSSVPFCHAMSVNSRAAVAPVPFLQVECEALCAATSPAVVLYVSICSCVYLMLYSPVLF